MTKELSDKLIQKYPDLFHYTSYVECYDGWFDLIDNLCKELTNLNEGIYFHQIKTKFAGLRAYIAAGSEHAHNIVRKYEKLSYTVCEFCSKPGALSGNRWLYTLCQECAASKNLEHNISLGE